MIKNVSRISIIGGPGTGKSTLSRNLGRELNLPVYHIDAINYLDNWQEIDKKERDKIILEKSNQSKWIIDGTYRGTLEARVKKADCIIFLNYSTIAKLKGIFSRYLKGKGKEKPETPGCKEQMNLWFLKHTIKWNLTKQKHVLEILERNKDKEILVFNNKRKLNNWYETEFNKKIEL